MRLLRFQKIMHNFPLHYLRFLGSEQVDKERCTDNGRNDADRYLTSEDTSRNSITYGHYDSAEQK